jgi:hypothetical protein
VLSLSVRSIGAVLTLNAAHGAVVMTVLSEPRYLGPRPSKIETAYLFDIDGDLQNDVSFGSSGIALVVTSLGANAAVLQIPAPPPDLGGYAAPLWAGALIGADPSLTVPGLVWDSGTSGMIICVNIGCGLIWHNREGFLGLRIDRGGDTHFGYMHFKADIDTAAGWIIGWAWETEPGKAIMTQPIPEQTSAALVMCVAFLAAGCRRRRMH